MVKVKCLSIKLALDFDTLEHMVGEVFVILYVHPLNFSIIFSLITNFSLLFMNMQMRFHIEPLDERTYPIESLRI